MVLAGLSAGLRRTAAAATAAAAAVLAVGVTGTTGARAAAGAPGAEVCPGGATHGDPLPSPALAATKIRDGFNFLEGPVWVATTGSLLFTDMQDGTGPGNVQPAAIRSFTPPASFGTVVADAGSNGLAITRDGTTILAATHDQRSLSSFRLPDLTRGLIAATYQGRRFNSPNDLTVRADGTVYFTDPDFQRGDRPDEMGGRTSVFRVGAGQVSLVDDTVRRPNGIALSPDGKTLYVGGNGDNKIFKYEVKPDGSTGPRTDFASLPGPDGVTVDCAGNIYWASFSDGKIHVFTPGGAALGTISAGRNTTNAAFGGPDGRTLYLTSGTPSTGGNTGNFGLYSIRLNVPGYPY